MSILLRIEAARNKQLFRGLKPADLCVLIGSDEEREIQRHIEALPDKGKVYFESRNVEFVRWVSGVVCGHRDVIRNFRAEVEIC
jgi:hypothetical protein